MSGTSTVQTQWAGWVQTHVESWRSVYVKIVHFIVASTTACTGRVCDDLVRIVRAHQVGDVKTCALSL